ncbi:MAG TPA: hypothetical protein VG126_04595 [Thermoleophilaceae bacterium]|nr:hypothetical protein [Thermoleophilaceae bacterium]
MRRLTITIAVLIAAAVAAPMADASTRQLTIMQDDEQVRGRTDDTLDEFARVGADIVKVNLYWDEVAPNGRRKPASFDGANPSDYDWSNYGAVADAILARGMRPFFSLGGRGPDWATGRRGRRGTYRPSATEFGRFAEAAGRQFPQVDIWSIWNEPNLYSWLGPQRRNRVPVSPSIYRNLYLAGHRGLRASGNGGDTILLGELMPRGGTDRRKVPPLQFLREMACLDGNYRQYRGRAARQRGCRRVGRIPTSGFAYHPYTLAGGPRVREAGDDAAIGQLGRVRATLDKIARRGKLPRRLKIWITEFGYQTRPPDPFGTPIGRAPNLMDLSEWIAYRNPRVATYAQYQLCDNDFWQSGLRFQNCRVKRRVYGAFRMPLLVRALGGNRVEVFGGLRSASGGRAQVESRPKGGRYRSRGSVAVNRAGYFRRIFRVTNAVRHTFRVTLDGRSRTKRVTR